jgi:hypothetical protein
LLAVDDFGTLFDVALMASTWSSTKVRVGPDMPSLFRFLLITATLAVIVYGGLYAVAIYFEPEPHEVSTPVPGVKVRK